MFTIKSVLRKCQDFVNEPGWITADGYLWTNIYPRSLFRKKGYCIQVAYCEQDAIHCGSRSMIQISCRGTDSNELIVGLEFIKTADGIVRPAVFPRTKSGVLYRAGDALTSSELKRATHLFGFVEKRVRKIIDEEMRRLYFLEQI
jgi:hypothetical protein